MALLSERIPQVAGLACVLCGQQYTLDDVQYVCSDCGQVGTLDVVLNPDVLWEGRTSPDRKANVWEEERFLPLAIDMPPITETIPLKVGDTPYHPRPEIGSPLRAIRPFAIKDDGRNPTASFKDRASAMVVHHAMTIGAPVVATASTGNAAAALAGMCAASQRVRAVIFVPAAAPQAKIAQLLVYGAKVILVDAPYDDAFDLCWETCLEFGWYNRSTGINPFTSEGKKTVSWEIAFSGYGMPDVIFVPVGDGSIISSVYKGFADLMKLGWIDRMPRLIGVQSAGSDALVHAWENRIDPREMMPRRAETIADSISAGLPRDRAKVLRAIQKSNGALIRVSDDEIIKSIPALAQRTGIFAEPAAASAYAGWQSALQSKLVNPDDHSLLLITGSGLKDIKSAMQSVSDQMPQVIPPKMAAVRDAVAKLGLV